MGDRAIGRWQNKGDRTIGRRLHGDRLGQSRLIWARISTFARSRDRTMPCHRPITRSAIAY